MCMVFYPILWQLHYQITEIDITNSTFIFTSILLYPLGRFQGFIFPRKRNKMGGGGGRG